MMESIATHKKMNSVLLQSGKKKKIWQPIDLLRLGRAVIFIPRSATNTLLSLQKTPCLPPDNRYLQNLHQMDH